MSYPVAAIRGRVLRPSGPTYISPSDLNGLVSWLKADAIAGLADGDPVTTWTDQSTNGKNFTQSNASYKPLYKTSRINSLPAVRFDGSDDYLQATGLSAGDSFTFFVVPYHPTTTTNTSGVFDSGPNTANVFRNYMYSWELHNGNPTMSGNYLLDINFVVMCFSAYVTPNRHLTFWRNGSQISSLDGTGTTAISWANPILGCINGNTSYFNGDVAEMILYNSVLSDSDRGKVTAYLGNKYGITVS